MIRFLFRSFVSGLFCVLTAGVVFSSALFCQSNTLANSSSGRPVSVFYNGSIRGDLGVMTRGVQARTVTLLKEARLREPDLISLCAGDVIGPSVTSRIDGGKAVIDVMNLCRYDVSGIGSHDFSYGWDNFVNRVKEADFPFVCSNIIVSGEGSKIIKPYTIVERGGAKVLVLGATSPKLPSRWPSWPERVNVADPIDSLSCHQSLADDVDLVVLLSNMEFEENIEVLKRLPWIHTIVSTIVVGTKLIDLSFREISLIDGRRLLWTFHSGRTVGFLRAMKTDEGIETQLRLQNVEKVSSPDLEALNIIEASEARTFTEQSEHLCMLSEDEMAQIPVILLNALRYELNAEIGLMDLSSIEEDEVLSDLTPHVLRQMYPYLSKGAVAILTGRENSQVVGNKR